MDDIFTPEQIAQILEEFFKVVGTRRYVGERYVPIFGRKGEESIQWDNSAPYEPLTIVLYQGDSYTSRQFVPIGVDITNQEFWAITGNYNAQIELYHSETIAAREIAESALTTANNAQNDINTLLPKVDFSAENTVKEYIDESITSIPTMSTTTKGIAKVGAGLAMNGDALELDGNGDIATAVTSWLNAHPEATTTVQDGSITDAKLVQTDGILSEIYEIGTLINQSGTASNYRLVASGSSVYDTSYQILKYYVTPGKHYWLNVTPNNNVKWQFQNAWNVPTGTNNSVVGTPCIESASMFVTVPSDATYIMVSIPKTDTSTTLHTVNSALANIGKDSQSAFIGEYDLYLEKDTTNNILYIYAGNWYIRSSISKTISISELNASIGTSTSQEGVANCISVPFGYSLYMSLLDYSVGIASSYTAYDGSKSILLAYVSTSGNLLAGAMYDRYLYELINGVRQSSSDVPSYFEAQLAIKTSAINENTANVGRDGFTMAFVTDPHVGYNSGNTPALIRYLNDNTRMKYVFNGGDIIDVDPSRSLALNKMAAYVGGFSFLNLPMFVIMGNHDYNSEGSIVVSGEDVTISQFYGAAMRQMCDVTYFDDYYDYYYTDKDSNTTVVCLQTGMNNGSYHVNQNDALATLLPTLGDNVIIIGHMFAHTVNNEPEPNANFNTLLNGNSQHAGLKTMLGGNKVKCILTGHVHADYTTMIDGFRLIATTTDSYKANTSYSGTVNELAFDVITFDFANNVVKCIRIGRGNDRTLSLS